MNEELIRSTVQKMRDAGLTEAVISSTLTDLGLSSSEVQAYLNPPAPKFTTPSPPPSPMKSNAFMEDEMLSPEDEALATRTSEKIVHQLNQQGMLGDEENSLKDSITHLAMEQHGEQLRDTHQAVMDLHSKLENATSPLNAQASAQFTARLDLLSKEIADTKGLLLALQTLMQKILEANQQIVFEMKKGK